MDIFVFGSNLLGIHGKGAALTARKEYGAVLGCGMGRTGNAYAIATKKRPTMKAEDLISIQAITWQIKAFLMYAEANPSDNFTITPIGCGLAGFKQEQIKPLFGKLPANCVFADTWKI